MRLYFLVLVAAVVAGCQSTATDAVRLTVDFGWMASDRCATQSPAFSVGNIPTGTETLDFRMVDLDVPTYHHGGGRVAHDGSGPIPRGAFTYKGPCPPSGSHTYEWTVRALNADGTAVGVGSAKKPFP